jgi:hypothetical protein
MTGKLFRRTKDRPISKTDACIASISALIAPAQASSVCSGFDASSALRVEKCLIVSLVTSSSDGITRLPCGDRFAASRCEAASRGIGFHRFPPFGDGFMRDQGSTADAQNARHFA